MTPRNFWTTNEIKCMLIIIKELKVLHLLEQKILPVNDIYRGIQREMGQRGYNSKTPKQIQNKWNQLKSTYQCAKRNYHPEFYSTKDLEFREDIAAIVEDPKNITPATTLNTAVFMESYFDNRQDKDALEDNPLPEGDNLYKQGSYKKTFWKFLQQLKSVEIDVQENFIAKQRQLLENERRQQMERNERILEAFVNNTNSILKTTSYLVGKMK